MQCKQCKVRNWAHKRKRTCCNLMQATQEMANSTAVICHVIQDNGGSVYHIVIQWVETFRQFLCLLHDCWLKKFKDNRIKPNAEFNTQKIKLKVKRAHAEAMIKCLVVVVVPLQDKIEFTFLFDTLTKSVFYRKMMLSVNALAPFS